MTAPVVLLDAPATPLDCWAWLPREELTRLTAFALEMARLSCNPPSGERFMVSGDAWCDRRTFRDALLDNLALLIDRHGLDVGCWEQAEGMPRLQRLLRDYRRSLAVQACEQEAQP
ncbi:MAG: hypothetical protein WA917_11790 [Comamonas sp.]